MRERLSRPSWSVPSQFSALGPLSLRMTVCSSGSKGAISGAKTASTTWSATTASAMQSSGCSRRSRRIVQLRTRGSIAA
jgi:hypothetical protein